MGLRRSGWAAGPRLLLGLALRFCFPPNGKSTGPGVMHGDEARVREEPVDGVARGEVSLHRIGFYPSREAKSTSLPACSAKRLRDASAESVGRSKDLSVAPAWSAGASETASSRRRREERGGYPSRRKGRIIPSNTSRLTKTNSPQRKSFRKRLTGFFSRRCLRADSVEKL